MANLPNSCRIGNISVHPKNWNNANASIKNDWYIHYRFYDPKFIEQYPKGKQISIRGMNKYKMLTERRKVTQSLLEDELRILGNGYNPITKQYPPEITGNSIVRRTTPFVLALNAAFETIHLDDSTKRPMKTNIKQFSLGLKYLNFDNTPIVDVETMHIRATLDYCYKHYKWSNYTYNSCRTYLMMLFKELLEYSAIKSNIIRDISKRKH
ncbi:MAG: hypothetical protein LBE82_01840, partial [Chitinophagaceae bacterium]|nr:hypothetical protein [Chitinophagaceae bacterium]